MATIDPLEEFRNQLQFTLKPYFEMLANRFHQKPFQEWLSLVMRTRSSIVRAPEQYLGKNAPSQEVLGAVVGDLFDNFLSRYEPGSPALASAAGNVPAHPRETNNVN